MQTKIIGSELYHSDPFSFPVFLYYAKTWSLWTRVLTWDLQIIIANTRTVTSIHACKAHTISNPGWGL